MATTDKFNLSNKLKIYLNVKLAESHKIIKVKKRQRKAMKILYYTTTTASIIISTVLSTTAALSILPHALIIILPATSAILTAISLQFNFKDKSRKLDIEVQKLNKIKDRLNYVVTCNGDLTDDLYQNIISEFN